MNWLDRLFGWMQNDQDVINEDMEKELALIHAMISSHAAFLMKLTERMHKLEERIGKLEEQMEDK